MRLSGADPFVVSVKRRGIEPVKVHATGLVRNPHDKEPKFPPPVSMPSVFVQSSRLGNEPLKTVPLRASSS